MPLRFALLAAFAHMVASIAIGGTLVLFVLDGVSMVLTGWSTYLNLVAFNIGRYPHGFYVAAALACMMIVPIRATLDEIRPERRGKAARHRRTVVTAILVPLAYWIAATILTIVFQSDMTIYARMTAGMFMPMALGLWALASIPVTLAASYALARLRRPA